jgi:glycerol-3-phosphate dehydrogenase
MRPRDLARLESTAYDCLVIGGGIHGLAVAYDAASRGLRVALVEADDFGSRSLFTHHTTAIGGPGSLCAGHVGHARQAIRERRALARLAPWFLRTLPFIVGTYRSMLRNRLALRAIFKMDSWLGRHRNQGVEPELHLPAPRLVSKAVTVRLFAGVRPDNLTGGAQWYDYQVTEGDRLTLAFAAGADRAGADLANHAEAVEGIRENGRIGGMVVRDRLTGRTFNVRSRMTVNVAGSRAGEVMGMFGVRTPFPLVATSSVVTMKHASDMALGAPGTDGRMLTLVPWRGRAMIGTSQSNTTADQGDRRATATELDALVVEANRAFPALKLTRADITRAHRHDMPASAGRNGVLAVKTAPEFHDHAPSGAEGAITVIGADYTTARRVAEKATGIVAKRLGKPVPRSRTGTTVLPGAGIADHEALAIEAARTLAFDVPVPVIRHLISLYAEAAAPIIRLMFEQEAFRQPVSSTAKTVGAEVVYAIRHEMALRLPDIVVRRTGLGAAGHPGRDAIEKCGALAAAELEWDTARTAEEMAAVEAIYVLPG